MPEEKTVPVAERFMQLRLLLQEKKPREDAYVEIGPRQLLQFASGIFEEIIKIPIVESDELPEGIADHYFLHPYIDNRDRMPESAVWMLDEYYSSYDTILFGNSFDDISNADFPSQLASPLDMRKVMQELQESPNIILPEEDPPDPWDRVDEQAERFAKAFSVLKEVGVPAERAADIVGGLYRQAANITTVHAAPPIPFPTAGIQTSVISPSPFVSGWPPKSINGA